MLSADQPGLAKLANLCPRTSRALWPLTAVLGLSQGDWLLSIGSLASSPPGALASRPYPALVGVGVPSVQTSPRSKIILSDIDALNMFLIRDCRSRYADLSSATAVAVHLSSLNFPIYMNFQNPRSLSLRCAVLPPSI